jgi:hypothetical protein
VSLELLTADGDPTGRDLDRLTSAQSADTVLFRIPTLVPGGYRIDWTATTTDGAALAGSIPFSLEDELAAAGGQNHRHGADSHLYQDSWQAFSLRVFFLLPMALLAGAFLRSRSKGSAGLLDRFAVRAAGGLLALAALIGAVVDAVAYVDEYHDYPLAAAVSAPGMVMLLPLLGLAAYLLATGRSDRVALWAAVSIAAIRAGLGHGASSFTEIGLYAIFAVTMFAVPLLWAVSFAELSFSTPSRRSLLLWASAALTAIAGSFSMLFLHAGTFSLRIDFADDRTFRLVAAGLLAGATMLTMLLSRTRRPLRLVGFLPFVLLVAASSALLWMPPPAAGL